MFWLIISLVYIVHKFVIFQVTRKLKNRSASIGHWFHQLSTSLQGNNFQLRKYVKLFTNHTDSGQGKYFKVHIYLKCN